LLVGGIFLIYSSHKSENLSSNSLFLFSVLDLSGIYLSPSKTNTSPSFARGDILSTEIFIKLPFISNIAISPSNLSNIIR